MNDNSSVDEGKLGDKEDETKESSSQTCVKKLRPKNLWNSGENPWKTSEKRKNAKNA